MIVAIFVGVWLLAIVALPQLISLACSEVEAEPSILRPTVYAWVRELPQPTPEPTPILMPDWNLAGAWPL
ncbi:hypothetical protein [Nocardia sp. NPDC046763]|uniref:hypothetical protein n=1 Tax=Nocardia sp. NPDC046763 TaxID=3155256 RepID=UPI0033D58CAB